MLDKNGEPCLIVGKRGKATGMTWGCGNELKSCVRGEGTKEISMEWCIVPIGRAFPRFAEPGDSGSAVFDVTGRVAGILTGGARLGGPADVTYVTPMAWIQEDMKKYGYSVEIASCRPSLEWPRQAAVTMPVTDMTAWHTRKGGRS
jgi:hypothetical protein